MLLGLVSRPLFRSAGRLAFTGIRLQSNLSINALNKQQLPFRYIGTEPLAVKYTNQHEWIAAHEDGTAFVGITKYAADALGDVTYVELPTIETQLEEGDNLGSVESVKSASELYTPASGTVVEVNDKLDSLPQLINEDPMGAGWLCRIKLDDTVDIKKKPELMTLNEYEEFLQQDN
ncbi:HDL190Wp [Eremothecium sinecaudum]|uniref:Glycine cleavage system H protein n=1 Tax=Eremothecium sinecaudum TaxID=45286 RepID=A0A0X8HSC3_9SACH|nr:HDL190Wp [Eremothecium sinecaudum]AMD20554.1 HDL190Wp [Eremothecium sinecaudum]